MPQCSDDVQQINVRLSRVETELVKIKTAFTRNDLGEPDYENHRKEIVETARKTVVMDSYKQEATRKIVGWLVAAILTLMGYGLIPYMRSITGGG